MDTRRRGGVTRVSDDALRRGVCRENMRVALLEDGPLVHRDDDDDDDRAAAERIA